MQILVNFLKMTEYEHEYLSAFWKWQNTIRLFKNDQIQIRLLFSFLKMTEYEYYSAFKKWLNRNMNTIWLKKRKKEYVYEYYWPNTISIRIVENYQIRIQRLFGFWEFTEYKHEYYLAFWTLNINNTQWSTEHWSTGASNEDGATSALWRKLVNYGNSATATVPLLV